MNTLSRVHEILAPAPDRPRRAQIVRVVVTDVEGPDRSRLVLAPGDRLIVANRSRRTLHVAPQDFFGNSFGHYVLEPGESTPALVVQGLWFQVEMHVAGRKFYPLDVYLAANTTVV